MVAPSCFPVIGLGEVTWYVCGQLEIGGDLLCCSYLTLEKRYRKQMFLFLHLEFAFHHALAGATFWNHVGQPQRISQPLENGRAERQNLGS